MRATALIEATGRQTIAAVSEIGYLFMLGVESLFWLLLGPFIKQPVRLPTVFDEMMKVGVLALPIVCLLSFANGIIMAIQGIATLKEFDAESQVVPGLAYSITREFGVLIAAIVVAGRSGSAIAARIGSMKLTQEIDALRVMGVQPVRFIVAPILIATVAMLPILTILADASALFGAGLYTSFSLNISVATFFERTYDVLAAYDVLQGLIKSVVFGLLIGLVACSNGFAVEGGSEGLGRATTRSVVLSIAAIVIADMVFTYFLTR